MENGSNSSQGKNKELNFFESTVTSFLSKFDNNFRIFSLNINSIDKKFEDILFLLNGQLDILDLNESKLNSKHDESLFEHPCYDLHRLDRLINNSGGVMVYVKKNLKSSRVMFDDNSEIISFVIDI